MTRAAVTIEDVAERANASAPTVSRVLNGRPGVSADLRTRVLEAASELGYQRAPSLLALVIPDPDNPFFLQMRPALQDSVEAAGHSLVLVTTPVDQSTGQMLALMEHLRRSGIKGAFFIPGTDEPMNESITSVPMPIVLIDRQVAGAPTLSFVGADDHAGIELALHHLHELGHTAIGFVEGPATTSTGRTRRSAFLQGMSDIDLEVEPAHIFPGDFRFDGGLRAGRLFLDLADRPSAVICANDLLALGFMRQVVSHGLTIPRDVSVVGYDGILASTWWLPSLTTLSQPVAAIADLAAETMGKALRSTGTPNEQAVAPAMRLTPTLSVRESSDKPYTQT